MEPWLFLGAALVLVAFGGLMAAVDSAIAASSRADITDLALGSRARRSLLAIADDTGATVVDFWRMREYRDPRMWDVDRIHMSSLGHQHMAVAVLDALGVPHAVDLDPLPDLLTLSRRERREADLAWARTHAAPWVQRRLTGRSSGDGLRPRLPELTTVRPEGRSRSGTI